MNQHRSVLSYAIRYDALLNVLLCREMVEGINSFIRISIIMHKLFLAPVGLTRQ